MKCRVFLMTLGLAFGLVACGGGGGNPGTTSGQPPPVVVPAVPSISLALVNAAGAELTSPNLSQIDSQFLKVGLKDAAGKGVPNSRVTITLESAIAVLVPSTGQLTDASGFAQFKVQPASVTSAGVVLATAAGVVDGAALTKTMDLQISSGTVVLSGLSATPQTVQKGQSVNVKVTVSVNGKPASSNSVAVEFSSSCGSATPAQAVVDSAGQASAVIQTTSQGDCSLSATAVGATVLGSYVVTAPPVTGLLFVKASPSVIYQQGSPGVNTSQVTFKVIDSIGDPVAGVAVTAALTNTDGGINFCGSPATATSGSDGLLVFSVCGGTLPATVQVRAALAATPSKYTDSNILTIQTGLPTQRFFDMGVTKHNFLVGGYFTNKYTNATIDIIVNAADRQGNPVPDGTPVPMVAEGGQLNSGDVSSCILKAGTCKVTLIGQEYRPMGSNTTGGDPRPGRVTITAFMDGEEYFIDANNNNRYDEGELFEDLGVHFMDKDENLKFDASYKNLVTLTDEGEVTYPIPEAAVGTKACPTNSNIGLSKADTCNGKWDRLTKVRNSVVVIFSGDEIAPPGAYDVTIPTNKRTEVLSASRTGISLRLADHNGNPMPADATLATEVIPLTTDSKCAAKGFEGVYGSTTEPRNFGANLVDCVAGDIVNFYVTVSTPTGASKKTGISVTVP
ncbi:MAG: hypothetical protein IPO43_20650 [Rhodoferax sp.]|nr:hypothetical protein [Rhodoferax sp.]